MPKSSPSSPHPLMGEGMRVNSRIPALELFNAQSLALQSRKPFVPLIFPIAARSTQFAY